MEEILAVNFDTSPHFQHNQKSKNGIFLKFAQMCLIDKYLESKNILIGNWLKCQ